MNSMIDISDEDFSEAVEKSIERIPSPYRDQLSNIGFFTVEEAGAGKLEELGMGEHDVLFGLYEGVPLTERGGVALSALPDKITVYKKPHQEYAKSLDDLKQMVFKTVWHEVAHYFGLNHDRIRQIERQSEI